MAFLFILIFHTGRHALINLSGILLSYVVGKRKANNRSSQFYFAMIKENEIRKYNFKFSFPTSKENGKRK